MILKKILLTFFILVFIFMVQECRTMPEDSLQAQPLEYEADGLRNPFQTPIEEEKVKEQVPQEPTQVEPLKPLPSLTIQGIVWGGSLPQAIINNKVLKVGDTIEEVRIVDINKDGVTVLFGGQQYSLYSPAAVNLQSLKPKLEGGKYNEE